MTRSAIMAWAALLIGSGCGASAQRPGAPATFVLQGDADGVIGLEHEYKGFSGGAALGFEAPGCCGIGANVTYWHVDKDLPLKGLTKSDRDALQREVDAGAGAGGESDTLYGVNRMLGGGVEVSAELLAWLRLRLRADLAGTPPTTATLGRKGFAGSLAAVVRLTELPPLSGGPLEVGKAAPLLDLVVACQAWTFEEERTSAGLVGGEVSSVALMLGLRFGASYGLDLR